MLRVDSRTDNARRIPRCGGSHSLTPPQRRPPDGSSPTPARPRRRLHHLPSRQGHDPHQTAWTTRQPSHGRRHRHRRLIRQLVRVSATSNFQRLRRCVNKPSIPSNPGFLRTHQPPACRGPLHCPGTGDSHPGLTGSTGLADGSGTHPARSGNRDRRPSSPPLYGAFG